MYRIDFPGDVHFVTFRTYKKYPFFKDKRCCEIFVEELDFYRNKLNLKIYGYVIMPDHVHLLIYFDNEKFPELTISKVMQNIKSFSARMIIDYLKQTGSQEPLLLAGTRDSRLEQGLQGTHEPGRKGLKYRFWQPDFYDFNIYTLKKINEKLDYIHKNPVKAGIVKDIFQYKYCSWRNYNLADQSIFKINLIEY